MPKLTTKRTHKLIGNINHDQLHKPYTHLENKEKFTKYGAIISAILILPGCSSAGFEGYGPKGDGFIGSAYGYSNRKISENTWHVEYVEIDALETRMKAIQRANELCIENGYRKAKYEPQMSGDQGLVTAYGIATCTNEASTTEADYSEASAIRDRISEIDAQISALRTFDSYSGRSGTLMDIVSISVEKLIDKDHENKISALQAERAKLTSRLEETSIPR